MVDTFLLESAKGPLAQKARYNANNLARLYGISKRQLQRIFRRQGVYTPQQWLDEQRIIAAKQLLLSGCMVKQVASELGYKQTSHFCRHFKLQSNMTPSQFVQSVDLTRGFVANR